MRNYLVLIFMFSVLGLCAQQQELYTFCQGSSYGYLLDTSATTTSQYYARWNIGSTSYSAHMQKDTIYQTYGTGTSSGGAYGSIKKWACTGTTTCTCVWTYTLSNAHHDICPLPNGNVLAIVDESKTSTQISAAGGSYSSSMNSPTIVEIHPTGSTTGTIVWQWKLWDHLCQNANSSVTSTYVTSIAANPQLFNVRYNNSSDWIHMNGIDYNAERDEIVLSSHYMNEIYVIDHSTTTAQAATHTGGNAGHGGDFLYRWGNPAAYSCTAGGNGITLNTIHDVRWVSSNNTKYPKYISIFHNNGGGTVQAVLFLPPYSTSDNYNFTYTAGSVIPPTSCTKPTIPSITGVSNQGGLHVLDNGNILITKPGTSFYECSGSGTTYQTVSVGTIQADRLKKCEVLGPFPTASVSASSVCANSSIILGSSATAPLQTSPSYTYSWSSTPSTSTFSSTSAQNPTVTPTVAGTYTYVVTVTSGGCSNTASVTVNVTSCSTISATASASPSTVCSGASTQLSATPSGGTTYTYSWSSSPAGFTSTLQNPTVSPTVNTTYTVTVTSETGSTTTATTTVTATTLPTIAVSASPTAICNGFPTTLTASGGTTYTWDNSLGTGNPKTVTPTSTTTYHVTGTNASSCSNTSSITITVNALPTVAISPSSASVCSGSSSTLTASGGTTYTWDNSLGAGNPKIVTPTSTTTYHVTGTDANSCSNTASTIITVNALPTVSISPSSASVCSGSSSTLTASGGTTYTWDNSLGSGNPKTVTPTSTTTYHVTGTDANSCSNTASTTITVNALPAVQTSTTTSTCGGATGTATASASGGTGNYTFIWSDNQTSSTTTNLAAGTYTVTVSDGNNCTVTGLATITDQGAPVVTVNASATSVCQGSAVSITASGADSYTWSPSQYLNTTTGSSVESVPLESITYTVSGLSGNCTGTQTVSITVLPLPSASFSYTDQGLGQLTFTDLSQDANAFYWTFGDGTFATMTNPSHTYVSDGLYVVTLIASNNCGSDTVTQSINVVISSIGSTSSDAPLIAFPNPTKGIVYIKDGIITKNNFEVSVYNEFGKLIFHSENSKIVDLSEFSNGIYVFTIKTDDDILNKKIILMK